MALITDPDSLNQSTEVVINTGAKTIQLLVAGNLSNDGVTGQALYSFLKEEWRASATLILFSFPMIAITSESFEFTDGWAPADDTTRQLIRSAGWEERDTSNNLLRTYSGIVSLATPAITGTAYYSFAGDTTRTTFDFTGNVNQAIQVYGDASNGNFDHRTDVLTLYVRNQAQTFGKSTTTDIGVSTLENIVYRFPLSESDDSLKITNSDATIGTTAPYTSMSITWGAAVRSINGVNRNFSIVIDGANATAEQIYEFVQYQLRQNSDIDAGAGTQNGYLSDELLAFTGDTLKAKLTSDGGIYIDNFNANDTNRLVFVDDTGTERTFPFVAAGTLTFNDNIQNDSNAVYRLVYTTNPAGDFPGGSAVTVNDNSGSPIAGNVGGNASIAFDFDYDNNVQGGRTAATDAAVTLIVQGLSGTQYATATATITRNVGLVVPAQGALERNYTNPA